jgi:hypothetical protein
MVFEEIIIELILSNCTKSNLIKAYIITAIIKRFFRLLALFKIPFILLIGKPIMALGKLRVFPKPFFTLL